MARVCDPLRALGGVIAGQRSDDSTLETAPLEVSAAPQGGGFAGGSWRSPVASAQVKSCLLLAGLCSGEAVTVHEPHASRDHTERMLRGQSTEDHKEAASAFVEKREPQFVGR